MKYIYLLGLVFLISCFSPKMLQVRRVRGEVTDVKVLSRYPDNIKEVKWSLSDKTTRYEIVKEEDNFWIGQTATFLIPK